MGSLRKYRFGEYNANPSSKCRRCAKEMNGQTVKGQWCSVECYEEEVNELKFKGVYYHFPKV